MALFAGTASFTAFTVKLVVPAGVETLVVTVSVDVGSVPPPADAGLELKLVVAPAGKPVALRLALRIPFRSLLTVMTKVALPTVPYVSVPD